MIRAPVTPELIRWSCKRSGISHELLVEKFKKLPEWEDGNSQPTLKQAETFARTVHVPVGYLFLTEPPEESIPISDFRTFQGSEIMQPTANLLDTIYMCQERQNWYRDYVRATGESMLDFIGSASIENSPATVAAEMREVLEFDHVVRQKCQSWTDGLRLFIQQAEDNGILVMVSDVVRNNNFRRLDPSEFRGFALSDPCAPLIFINDRNSKAAQIFTLAHEIAHLWLGLSALSNIDVATPRLGIRNEEIWCNAVAAEFLVPLIALRSELKEEEPLSDTLSRLTRKFKVSTLVILRRLLDTGWINRKRFDKAWRQESENLRTTEQSDSDAGNFYHTALARASPRFTRALIASTLEGQTLYRDAFRMLGIKKYQTFNKIVDSFEGTR